jgi:DNA repair photolyase
MNLFGEEDNRKNKIGQSAITYASASSILTPGKGFMDAYDYTLNPYSGCTFGCNYCYAAFFSRTEEQKNNWGYWLKVKENALHLLLKYRKKPLIDKTIYLSSVTDPINLLRKRLSLQEKS